MTNHDSQKTQLNDIKGTNPSSNTASFNLNTNKLRPALLEVPLPHINIELVSND